MSEPFPHSPREHIERFLSALFDTKPDDALMQIVSIPCGDKTRRPITHYARDVQTATQLVERLSQSAHQQLYCAVALSAHNYGRHSRCPESETYGVAGLWMDLDFHKPGHHRKPGLPSEEQVHAFVQSLPLPPTIIVHTGGGLQLWWLFHEVLIFTTDEERTQFARIAKQWEQTVQEWGRQWAL